eukprot:TRINITY_DN41510_c0_g1_i1.p1 TRINITY_DN41510_c0_g1~~TRINITY_DN41510_c0_g1_i1.p1  ORF type:complete len:937 (-),score=134.57 TRINITY_DN41510_c0_g1_i1:116-2926(-)
MADPSAHLEVPFHDEVMPEVASRERSSGLRATRSFSAAVLGDVIPICFDDMSESAQCRRPFLGSTVVADADDTKSDNYEFTTSFTCASLNTDLQKAVLQHGKPKICGLSDNTHCTRAVVSSCVVTDSVEKVLSLMENRADPNVQFEFTEAEVTNLEETRHTALASKKFMGPVLTVAVWKRAVRLIEVLIQGGACPEVEYSFRAGASKTLWSGPMIFLPIAKGQSDILELLVRYSARLDVQSTIDGQLGATPLWQASYFERLNIMNYLLDRAANPEVKATFQDDTRFSHTPLHIASKFGRVGALKLLLERKADVNTSTTNGESTCTPLKDAILHCHSEVIPILVAGGAKVFCDTIDYSIWARSSNLIAAKVAEGLKENPADVYSMKVCHLTRFLTMPGNAPVYTFSALFRKCRLMYWENTSIKSEPPCSVESDGKTWTHEIVKVINRSFSNSSLSGTRMCQQPSTMDTMARQEVQTASIDQDIGINVCVGPSWSAFNSLFLEARPLLPRGARRRSSRSSIRPGGEDKLLLSLASSIFKDKLAPTCQTNAEVIVDVYECLLPGIHTDPDVLFALKRSPCNDIFNHRGCQAMIISLWMKFRGFFLCTTVANLISLVLFVILSTVLGGKFQSEESPDATWRWVLISIFVAILLYNSVRELMQFLGYVELGYFWEYVGDMGNAFDFLQLVFDAMIVNKLLKSWTGFSYWNMRTRVLFAAAVLMKWLRVGIYLKGSQTFGRRVLPILRASKNVMPFVFVVVCPFFGLVHSFHMLSLNTSGPPFFSLYQIFVSGGMDPDFGSEIQRLPASNGKETPLQVHDSFGFEGKVAVLAWYFLSSLLLAILMMNILVAVLTTTYQEAWGCRDALWYRERTNMVCDWMAVDVAWNRSRSRLFASTRGSEFVSAKLSNRQGLDSYRDHLWYCCPRETEAVGVDEQLCKKSS